MRKVLALTLCSALLLAWGCNGSRERTLEDEPRSDGGGSDDGGRPPGAPSDGGGTEDAEPLSPDAGDGSDSGRTRDAGIARDAGGGADAGRTSDGGLATDGGHPMDAGGVTDAGRVVDAGTGRMDAGTVDAGRVFDCRRDGCEGFRWCDRDTGSCRLGCERDDQCGSHEVCDLGRHTCTCAAGTHSCGDACVPDDDVDSCGDRCTPCPTDPHGMAVCDDGACGLRCDEGALLCGSACAVCPSGGGVLDVGCVGERCVALACGDGLAPCADGCCAVSVEWEVVEVVDSAARGPKIAIDPDGRPRLAYLTDEALVVARWTGTRWATNDVAFGETGNFRGYDIVVDADGVTHVAYWAYMDLRYARIEDGAVTGRTVEDNFSIRGGDPSMAIDGDGSILIAYEHGYTPRLATQVGSGWRIEEVGDGTTGTHPVVAVTPGGRPEVVIVDGPADQVVRMYRYGDSWYGTRLGGEDSLNLYAAFTIDGSGARHIVTWNVTERAYAYWTNAGGSLGPAPPPPGAAQVPAMASHGDRVWVVGVQRDGGGLEVATKTAAGWSVEQVAPSVSDRPDIAIDAEGRAHVAFLDGTTGGVRWATSR